MPLAFGIPYAELTGAIALGNKVESLKTPKAGIIGGRSNYGYLIKWDELYAPAALNELLNAGLVAKVATNSFETGVSGGNKNLVTAPSLYLLPCRIMILKLFLQRLAVLRRSTG